MEEHSFIYQVGELGLVVVGLLVIIVLAKWWYGEL